MIALTLLVGCYATAPAEDPFDYTGTWRVGMFSSGPDCNFPELTDYGASHVQIVVTTGFGDDTVGVYPCDSETDCDTSFSDYELAPVDSQTAEGVVEGDSWFDGLCDFFWVRTSLQLDGGVVLIESRTEGNLDEVPAGSSTACDALLPSYGGAVECLRTERLVLEPL